MRSAALLAVLVASACAPPTVELDGFDGLAWVAALHLDASGALMAGSEVRALGGGVDLFSRDPEDGSLVVVGWPADAWRAPGPEPVVARSGCAPRLPAPAAAVDLAGASVALDRIPALSAPWADALCPALDLERIALRVGCKPARCPWELTRESACTARLEVPCVGLSSSLRVDPDGALCLAPLDAAACTAVEPLPGSAGQLQCVSPEPCAIEAYIAPVTPALEVERVQVSDAARLVPDAAATGGLGKLPSVAHLIGLAHDVAIVGDRVVVSTATVARSRGCGDSVLHALDLDTLAPVATTTAARCLLVLAGAGAEVLGISVEGARFVLDAYTPQLARVRRTPIDDRTSAGAGEPPIARPECERPVELLVDDAHVYALFVRGSGCGQPGTTVHVLDRARGAVRSRHALPATTPWRARLVDGELWLADASALRVTVHRLPELTVRETYDVPPGFARVDVTLFDFARDAERGELVVATTRDQPVVRRDVAPGAFADRAYFLPHEADPVALWTTPLVGAYGLVLGTRDARADWPTEVALYDRERLVVLPGGVSVGYGPPRRLLADGRGGVIALMPWEASVVRIRAAR